MPFEEFIRNPLIEKLTTGQQIAYGMIGNEELLKTNNPKQLYEAIEYYISEAKLQPDLNQNSPVVDIIFNLLKKVGSLERNFDDNLSFISYCTYLYRIRQMPCLFT